MAPNISVSVLINKKDGSYLLSGKKVFVADGISADKLIVAARTAGKVGDQQGISLFLVDSGAKVLKGSVWIWWIVATTQRSTLIR